MQPIRARAAAILGLIVLVSSAAQVLAAENALPQIDECRIGFDGTFKVGHWTPVWVDVAGDVATAKATIEVATVDSDGVEVTNSAAAIAGTNLLYTRVGRLGSSVHVKLILADGRVVARAEISPRIQQAGGSPSIALPATGQLVVQIGPGDLEIEALQGQQDFAEGSVTSNAVQLVDVESLPTDWFGYDAVDVVVLTTNDAAFCERLVADTQRFTALRDWLELGGRLAVCAGRTAPQLLGADGPLAEFAPGRITELVRLSQAQALENFAGSGDAISGSGAQQNIPLPRLEDVQGRVELFGRGTDLPVVVRAARGLGELTFVGIDLTEPPFADWNGRSAFLRRVLRPYLADEDATQAKQKLVSLGYDDIAGALRQRLGRSFADVVAIGFPWMAALVIGYLLILGPLDFWFVDRVTRRPWVAWLTLPVIVVATSLGAALLAGAAKRTDNLRINHAELVDFDLTTDRTRGFCWATLFSPQARRFDVSLAPRMPDGQPAAAARPLVTWLGLPGTGLGGMHAAGEPLDVAGVGYRTSAKLDELVGVPILTAATKSFFARWTAARESAAAPPLAAELAVDADGLLVGSVTNNTGAPLVDAYLLHGQWGYRLGDLQPGQRLDVGPQLNANRVKSIVARRARPSGATDQETFLADRANVSELLSAMMFYDAVGGAAFAGLPSDYQADLDLSHLLTFDRAILIAAGKNRGSQWQDAAGDQPLESDQDTFTTLYRFILPLNTAQPSTLNSQP